MEVDLIIIEVLYFLNEVDFSDKLDTDQLEKIEKIKTTIEKEFEDKNLSKMLHTLNTIDDIEKTYVTNNDDIDHRAERTQSVRSNIFYLVSFKQLVQTEKQENEWKFDYNISPSERINKQPEVHFIFVILKLTFVFSSSLT